MYILVGLLSNDGDLEVKIMDDDYPIIVNPKDPSWRPNPKYILCNAHQPDRIESLLASLHGPFRFVVAFEYGSLFHEGFGLMLYYLSKKVFQWPSNDLKTIAMDIPYDESGFDYHIRYMQTFITDAVGVVDFEIRGMHTIVKSGPISEMPDLLSELAAIQSIVDE